MAGLPGTGKTSFLALLWLAILRDRTPGLKLASFQDDRAYLNLIASRLERCDPAPHTEVGEDRVLALSLLVGEQEEPSLLRIPDLSGETWLDAAVDRHWPVRVEEQVTHSGGLLLFMHARDFDSGATIGQVNELAAVLDQDSVDAENADGASVDAAPRESVVRGGRPEPNSTLKPRYTPPTQVALVDALQLICEHRGQRRARVSIVISAWDLAGEGVTPAAFITKNLPLLAQYLESSRTWLEVRVFGLSAQGGEFCDADVRDTLVRSDSIDRADVRDFDGKPIGVHEIALWSLRAP
jgi:hypothetical protein